MPITCSKCSRLLPQVATLKYRFCPHCGTEIEADSDKHQDALLTTPPELTPRQPEQQPGNLRLDTETGKKPTLAARFDDQPIAPRPMASRPRPELKPPDTPPPASFFRTPSETLQPPPPDIQTKPPAKNRTKIIVAVLVSLAVIILIVGGLLSF